MPAFAATDLVLRPGLPFNRTFRFERDGLAQPWTGRTTRLQVKHPWQGTLLIELTAFLEINPSDATALELSLPASFTAKLDQEGIWDLLTVASADTEDRVRVPARPGRVLVIKGVTGA